MSSNDNKPTFPAGNPTDRNDPDHVVGAVNPQEQLLLEALQQFIVPHVGAAMGGTGSNQNLRGPEAIKLVTALKEFISSVVRGSELKAETTIEVNLDEEVQESESAQDVANADANGQEHEVSKALPDILSISYDVFNDYNLFRECVLRRLREHVFNRMPIRLLCFVPQGQHLRISIADKEDIYAHLVSVMEEHTSDPDYQPIEVHWEGPMETDDQAATRLVEKYTGYAILSHTWLHAFPGEVTYADWTNGVLNQQSAGYQKLANFCKVAWKNHRLTLGWIDTICINKNSSSELDESIRSMYNWYKGAKVCIVYLADTQTMSTVHRDPWFTRGWTLQELLAPNYINFYNWDWKCLAQVASFNYWSGLLDIYDPSYIWDDSRSAEIREQIHKATTITDEELEDIFKAPLSRRMQLAASRKVTREEDMAYSLMGIFNVSISTAYGEGAERAFRRLLYEILNSTSRGVLDIFNWAGIGSPIPWLNSESNSQLLPSSLVYYIDRSSDVSLHTSLPLAPLTITHMGLYIPVLLMPTVLDRDQEEWHNPVGDYRARLTVSMRHPCEDEFTTTRLLLLDIKAFDADKTLGLDRWYQVAVFNIRQSRGGIYIPKTCIAKLLCCSEIPGRVTNMGRKDVCYTEEPLVFDMKYSGPTNPILDLHNICLPEFWIPEHELAKHGMQFISLYL